MLGHNLKLHDLNHPDTQPTVLTKVKDVSQSGQLGPPTIIDTWKNGQLDKGVEYRLGSPHDLEQNKPGYKNSSYYRILKITLPRPGDEQQSLRDTGEHQMYFEICSKLTTLATQGRIATQSVYTHILHNIQPADDALICDDFEELEVLRKLSTLSIVDDDHHG